MKPRLENSSHKELRSFLRVVGPLVVIVGVIFTIVGLISFFSAFGSFGTPRYFWCAFIGMPMVVVGLSICQFAYLGSVQRYVASETAPVARDTFNYMVDGTQESMKTLSRSVGQGIREAIGSPADEPIACPHCHDLNAADANFCNGCGAPIAHQQICHQCKESNDNAAKFCDHCGSAL